MKLKGGYRNTGMYLRSPRRITFELSSQCNARCPMCPRELTEGFPVTQLSYETIKRVFDGYQFDVIKHGGNFGDPLLCKDLLKIVKFFEPQPQVIHTNGSLRNLSFWDSLAKIKNLIVVFGIDGTDHETHVKYRIGTDFEKIMNNCKIFINAGGVARWQFIIFEHNEHQLEKAREMAADLGFKEFDFIYTRRFYLKDQFDHMQHLNPPSSQPIFSTEYHPVVCKSKQLEEIYVAADGSVFACEKLPNDYTSDLNIHEMSFEEIYYNRYFDELEYEYNNNPCDTCKVNCGISYSNVHKREKL